jgi:hypothetical protein
MRPHEHEDDLTSEQRCQRIAALLAAGLRRLRPRLAYPDQTNNPPDLSPNCLELADETRLSVHTG